MPWELSHEYNVCSAKAEQMTKLRWVEIFKNNTAANLFLMMSTELWSVTVTWSQGWAVLQKKILALVCAGRVSFWCFISFKCFVGSSGFMFCQYLAFRYRWSCLRVWAGCFLPIHFSWVHEIYVAIKANQSHADCTSTYLKVFEVPQFSQSKTTTWGYGLHAMFIQDTR